MEIKTVWQSRTDRDFYSRQSIKVCSVKIPFWVFEGTDLGISQKMASVRARFCVFHENYRDT